MRELRALGASVIKIAADGSVTLAFEGAYLPEASAATPAASTTERAAAEERELLMASADED